MTHSRGLSATRPAKGRKARHQRWPQAMPAAAVPLPHPSWFGHAVDPAERLAPDQFWARLGL